MGGGGLMQLVAYGAQDVYLSSNPQITFFKLVYRRHTNFSMESIEQVANGAADFGRKITATISRNGDLIHKMYLRVQLPAVTVPDGVQFRWLNWVGHILVKSVEIEIGGQRIDKHYGDFLHIWNELTQTAGHQMGYANMVGNVPRLTTPITNNTGSPITVPGEILYVPLQFWFNNSPGLALPLIALQYHEVKVNLELNEARACYWAGREFTPSGGGAAVLNTDLGAVSVDKLDASLFVDYIYLDSDERRRFAQAAHEYLITQLQFTGDESTSQIHNKVKLNFNHPCKELIWVVQPDKHLEDNGPNDNKYGKQWFNYTDGTDLTYSASVPYGQPSADVISPGNNTGLSGGSGGVPGIAAGGANNIYIPASFEGGNNPVSRAKLQLNGHDRFSERDGRYFNLVQPYQAHENVPSKGINVYSFALKPEEHQPSGTCNMSRIDNATLNLTLTPESVNKGSSAKIRVYAINYNVLRVMSGMGGLAYSN